MLRKIQTNRRSNSKQPEYDLDYIEYRITRKVGKIRWLDDYGHYAHSDACGGLYYVFISGISEKRQRIEADKAVRRPVIETLIKEHTVWLINGMETESFSLYRSAQQIKTVSAAFAALTYF